MGYGRGLDWAGVNNHVCSPNKATRGTFHFHAQGDIYAIVAIVVCVIVVGIGVAIFASVYATSKRRLQDEMEQNHAKVGVQCVCVCVCLCRCCISLMPLKNDAMFIILLTVIRMHIHICTCCGWLAVFGGREVSRYVLADREPEYARTNCVHVQPGMRLQTCVARLCIRIMCITRTHVK